MIDFVVCDDNDYVREINQKIIIKATMQYDFNYKVLLFEGYCKDLKKKIEDTSKIKIYLLDIEMPGKSGIEIAKEIRKTDWNSIIIILTTHEELELKVLREKLLILDFVSKFSDYESKIIEAIDLVLNKVNSEKMITFKVENDHYQIKLNSIIYVYKDSQKEKTVIVTDNKTYELRESLQSLSLRLDSFFCKTHRVCYVNINKISHVDFKNKIIYFTNNTSTDYLSRKYKKDLEEKVWLLAKVHS